MPKQRFYRSWFGLILLCLLSAFVLAACGADDEDPPEGNDDSDAESTDSGSEDEEDSEEDGGDDGPIAPISDATVLEIVNGTDVDICVIAVSASDAPDWGPNLLEGGSLPAGESFTTDELDPNRYDVLAQD